jgi:hypothetical protein
MTSTFHPLTADDQHLINSIKSRVIQDPGPAAIYYNQQPYPPVSLADIAWTETQIGTPLPPLIREIFLQVSNGGFGPGWGITGLQNGHRLYQRSFVDHVLYTGKEIKAHLRESIETAERDGNVDSRLIDQEKQYLQHWNTLGVETLIWYCNWGCNIVTLVDFSKPELPILCADGLDIRAEKVKTLREWWESWLDGSLVQP